MSLLPPIFTTLRASAAVVGWLGADPATRCFPHGEVPPASARGDDGLIVTPYVTWFLVSGTPENELSDVPGIDRCAVQVDVWADDGDTCEAAAKACRDAIEPLAHMTGIVVNGVDRETQRYRLGMQFDWWLSR